MGHEEQLTYSSYLKIPELLSLQKALSKPVAHDELLFIILHQTYELWFKQIIFELEAIVLQIEGDRWHECFHLMHRVSEIFRILIQEIDILETMTAEDFNRFRSNLNPASGFQSGQFREFELLVGLDPKRYAPFFKLAPEWKDRIEHREHGPNLRTSFLAALTRHGLSSGDKESVTDAVVGIYRGARPGERDPSTLLFWNFRVLCEGLIGLDEQIWLWRFRHLQMVERMIGLKPGTGGSLGAPYLETTLKNRLFPELWEARTRF